MFRHRSADVPGRQPSFRKKTTLFSSIAAAGFTLCVSACHSSAPRARTGDSVAPARALPMFKRNPAFRTRVKKEPVAEYRIKTDNPLNDLYFCVGLYETPATMKYVAKVEFEGLTGEDTIKLPDMGKEPHPQIQKETDIEE